MRHSCFLVLALSLSVAVAVDVRRVKAKVVVSGPQGVLAAPAKEGKYDPCAGKADGAVCKMCDPAAKGCAEDRALRMCAKGACVVGGKTAGAKAKGTVSEKDGAPVATAAAAKDKKNSKAKGDKVRS